MKVAPLLSAPAILLLDLAVACALAVLLDVSPRGPEAVVLLGWLAFFRHGAVLRWRAPSLILFGAGLSIAAAWLSLLALQAVGMDMPWVGCAWPIAVAPWPGHLLAWTIARLRPRTPAVLAGFGRARRLTASALSLSPGASYRLVTDGNPAATRLNLPPARWGDRSVCLETPSGPLPLFPEGPEEGMGRAVRRSLDLVLGGAALVLASPLILIFALAVVLTSRGPAFYGQVRVTRNERLFRIHKIRSMIKDAEPDGKEVWPQEGDTRITALGRVLRRFWLDELPQLVDVLRGPMSLVGPRPERPSFVKDFAERLPNYRLRHQVKAGMTGLSQVMGLTGNTSLRRRLHLDLRYAVNWTPLLDVKLMFATVFRMLSRLARKTKVP